MMIFALQPNNYHCDSHVYWITVTELCKEWNCETDWWVHVFKKLFTFFCLLSCGLEFWCEGHLFVYVRFPFVPLAVGKVKWFLNTVENALVKGEFVLGKISKSKFLLELAKAAFLEWLEKGMLDQEGMLMSSFLYLEVFSGYLVNRHREF